MHQKYLPKKVPTTTNLEWCMKEKVSDFIQKPAVMFGFFLMNIIN